VWGLLSAVALAAVTAAVVLAWGDGHRAPAPHIPVVVVPGYNGDRASVAPLVRRLRRAGRSVTALVLPDRGRGDVRESARVLARAVEDTGAASVDLIGFSAGGIVVRTYLDGLDVPGLVRRVVLLGVPNHGARIAEVAAGFDPSLCTGACAQLTPGSSLLAELNGRDETPYRAEYTSIWTRTDSVVTPPTTALLRGATNLSVQRFCPGVQVHHGELIWNPLSLGLVVEALRGRVDERPLPSCARLRSLGAGP
jgi:triacylglycerol lipase